MTNNLHYAVVVGINSYPGGYPSLRGPVADAEAFQKWLNDPKQGGLPATNIKTIKTATNPPKSREKAKPVKQLIDDKLWEMRQKLVDTLKNADEEKRADMRARSRLYLIVAGHGIMPGNGDVALLDARAQQGRQTNLELGRYLRWLREDGAFAEVCIFADCCRTFELLANPDGPGWDKPNPSGQAVTYVMASATLPGTSSFEAPAANPDDWRGHFSHALIEGLNGGAADPATGLVTSDTLLDYAGMVVAERTKDKPPRQRQTVPPADRNGVLTFGPPRAATAVAANGQPEAPRAPGRPLRRVVITFPAAEKGMVELVSPDGSTQPWDTTLGPWTVLMYDGTWYVQHANKPMDTSGFAGDGLVEVRGEGRDVQL